MKNFLLLALSVALLTACSSGPSKQHKVLAYASNTKNYERCVEVTDVEFTDTATILTFFYKNRMLPGNICILPQTYLSDEQDRHYKALFGVEHQLGEYFFPDEKGTYFHVGFEPMPSGIQIFDMKEGDSDSHFQIMGIHSPSYKPVKPEFSQAQIAEAEQIRRAIFRKGGVCLRGTIQGYDRSQNYQTYQLIYSDYFQEESTTIAIEIDSLGNFETAFDINHAIGASIIDQRNIWHSFIVLAGDTLDVVFMEDGTTRYSLSDGRPYPLENYNRLTQSIRSVDNWLFQFDKSMNLSKALEYARQWRTLGLEFVDYIAFKYGFSKFEYEYARIMAHNSALDRYLDFRMDIQHGLFLGRTSMRNPNSTIGKLLSGSTNRKMTKPEALEFIAGFPANDTLMMIMPVQWSIFNRYKYDVPFYSPDLVPVDSGNELDKASSFAWQHYLTDSTHLDNDRKLYSLYEPSLFGKICVMQDISRRLDTLKTYLSLKGSANPDIVLTSYLSKMKELMNDDNLATQVDLIYQGFIRTKAPYWDLPECRGKEVLKSILAKYPGKYVYLDFWSTGCGPCIAGIRDMFNTNRGIMTGNHDNFVMVFITSDPVQVYEPFRREWLKGAQSYRVSQDDYNAMAGLFNFSSIPHHELITPDGQAITQVPGMLEVDPNNPDPNRK